MNVERLARLLKLIVKDFEDEKVDEKIRQLATALQNKLNAPSPNNDIQFKSTLDGLFESLARSPLNDLTPSQTLAFEKVDASNKVGLGLNERVMNILSDNTMTMNLAQQQLVLLADEVSVFKENIQNLLEGLQKINVEPDYLEKGEAEISIVFPVESSETSLEYLKSEVDDLNKTFKILTEIIDGDTESTRLRAIGSSSVLITLGASLGLTLAVAKVINQFVIIYKNILDVRIKQEELGMIKGDKKVAIDRILKEAQADILNQGIEDLVAEIIEKYEGTDKGRKQELEGFLEAYLRKLAKKFDNGFGFEVESEEPEQPESDEEGHVDIAAQQQYELAMAAQKEIQNANNALKSLERHEGPILALDIGEDGEEGLNDV